MKLLPPFLCLIAFLSSVKAVDAPQPKPMGVSGWCTTIEIPAYLRYELEAHDHAIEEFVESRRASLAPLLKQVNEFRVRERTREREQRNRVVGSLEKILNEDREAGDPERRVLTLAALEKAVQDGQAMPLVLSPLSKIPRHGRKRRVTVNDKSATVSTEVFEGHEYALIPSQMSWYEAKRWCSEQGGYLACIETHAELAFLWNKVVGANRPGAPHLESLNPSEHHYWVGASDSAREGKWRWITGTDVDVSMFHRAGIPGHKSQPTDNRWGEHHAALVIYQPQRKSKRCGLSDWHGVSRSSGICEWGATGLPPPWDVLKEDEQRRTLEPWWKERRRLDSEWTALLAKINAPRKLRRLRSKEDKYIDVLLRTAKERLGSKRKDAIRTSDDAKATLIDGALLALEKSGDLSPATLSPVWSRNAPSNTVARFFGRSYIVIAEPMTWHDAQLHCRSVGGHLPDPRSRYGAALIHFVLSRSDEIDNTWLAIARQPEGANPHWRNSRGPLKESSPWVLELANQLQLDKQMKTDQPWLFGRALFLADTKETPAGAPKGHPETASHHLAIDYIENRRPFLCVLDQ